MSSGANEPGSAPGDRGACPDDPTLRALMNETLPKAQEAEISAHLDQCTRCQQRLDSLSDSERLVPTGSVEWTSTELLDGLSQMIRRLQTKTEASTGGGPNEASRSDPSLTFLQPTDHPGHLGRLGPYDVIEMIGRGGMGVVLKAHDPKLNRVVAIKLLLPEIAAREDARQRFIREARAAAAVNHDHIVTIHAVEEIAEQPCLVMAYIVGESLDKRVRDNGPPKLREIVRIGAETARGLEAAHQHGLVHRDVKPSNILLEENTGRVKITDFGLAKAVDDVDLTCTGTVADSPQFMAPEQALGERVDHRADLFALGSVLYYLSTGRPPFDGGSPPAVMRQVCDNTPPSIRTTNPEIPDWLVEIISKLMAKKPVQRYVSAGEVADALEHHWMAHEGGAVPSRRPSAPSKRTFVGAVIGLVVLVIVSEMLGWTSFVPKWWRKPTGFVIVGQDESYPTLADAAQAAPNDGVIEVRGDGPFRTDPILLANKSLAIRAAGSFHPVLIENHDESAPPLLSTKARLELEGIEVRWSGARVGQESRGGAVFSSCAVVSEGGSLWLVNCRFVVGGGNGCVGINGGSGAVRNCQLEGDLGILWAPRAGNRLEATNSIVSYRAAVAVFQDSVASGQTGRLKLTRNTLTVDTALQFFVNLQRRRDRSAGKMIEVMGEQNVIDANTVCLMRPTEPPRRQSATAESSEGFPARPSQMA